MIDRFLPNNTITNWKQFRKALRTTKDVQLLRCLDDFPDAVLVAGCQRSGTTVVANIINQSEGMSDYYWLGPDGELDAALLLSGFANQMVSGRCCFQTTYLNERYVEYFEHENYRLIWMLRNPFSVVYSMLYNWHDHSLNELFRGCGVSLLSDRERWLYQLFGVRIINRLRQACLGYRGKVSQLFEIKRRLNPDQLLIVDYDQLVQHKEQILPQIYDFIDLAYYSSYADQIHSRSVNKARNLSVQETTAVETICQPVYQQARQLSQINPSPDRI
jgi:hypothetical protein